MNCKHVINNISEILSDNFSEENFILKNNKFEKTVSENKKYQYVIDVKRSHDGYSLHLILKLFDKIISNGVNNILKKVLTDKEMEYPKNWTQKDIEDSIKIRTKNNIILMLTDWRIFKRDDEALEDFNNKFSIWFCTFNKIEEKKNWKEQLYTSIDFSKIWFKMADNEDYIIENTIYGSLYLLRLKNKTNYLNKKYQEYKLKCRDKKELELFYKYLTE
jgi:hypothetical protein